MITTTDDDNTAPTFSSPFPTTLRTYDDPNNDFDFISESPVCDSRESYVYPRTARNLRKKWRFVINVPGDEAGEDEYIQAVKVEKCLRPGRSCNIDSVTGSQTVCRQKYTFRRLLALSETGEQYIDSFKFPSCCVCYEKRSFGTFLMLRRTEPQMGVPLNDTVDPVAVEIA